MKIIKEGNKIQENIIWTVNCWKCDATLEYAIFDVKHDQREGSYVVCPCCTAYITHHS